MSLWHEFFELIKPLRKACARSATFAWLVLAILGFCTAPDRMGVSSFVRSAYLKGNSYHRLLSLFNGKALNVQALTRIWMGIVQKSFRPLVIGGRMVFVADGINIPKEGRKMPAVKSLHNASTNNSKATFIMGHSFQAVALLCVVGKSAIAVPLISRIVEGLTTSNRCTKSLLDKFIYLFQTEVITAFEGPKLLVADAYYGTGKVIDGLLQQGVHLITRMKKTSTAYEPAEKPKVKKRGRPAIYGAKLKLIDMFKDKGKFTTYPSPVYDETDVNILVCERRLIWRAAGKVVKFVWVIHPTRGNWILLCTDVAMPAIDIVMSYGYRFKIEVTFKNAIRGLGVYSYRFWSKMMTPIKRCSKGQFLHRETEDYREKMFAKQDAYHRFVQVGCIAQGVLQYLCVHHGRQVWASFRGYLRTMRKDSAPSEQIASLALQSLLPEFLASAGRESQLAKIIGPHIDLERLPGLRQTG